jgi:heme-degrading monooxygenase HmoA
MLIISFRSKLTPQAGDDYDTMAEEMERLAHSHDGFIEMKAFRAEDGERLTLVWWRDAESLKVWKNNVHHLQAQRMGREKWYEYYKIEVAEVMRLGRFDRSGKE